MISQTEKFRTKTHSMFGNVYLCESTFSTKEVKSKNRNRRQTKHWTIASDLLPLTLVLIKQW